MIDEVVLDNGLTIYTYVDERRHTNTVQFVTKFGGLYKDFKYKNKEYHIRDGIAHILEHYIVEENKHGNFLKHLGEMQMNTNASTHLLKTDFYFTCVEKLEEGIEVLLNGINNVHFDEERLNHLKNPIYQEIRGRSDSKFYHLDINESNSLFHSYKFRSIGGTIEEVENTTVEDLELCYKAFYHPSNQFIVICGNFDKDKIINVIRDFYKDLVFDKDKAEVIKIEEEPSVVRKKSTIYYPTPKEYVDINYKINISKYSPIERLKLDFYIHCFFKDYFGVTSKLYKKMVDEEIITNGIGCGERKINDYLIISFGSYSDKVKEFTKYIHDTVNNLKEFDEDLFELNKKNTIISFILRDDNVLSVVMPFIDNIIDFDYPYMDKIEDIKEMNFKEYQKYIKELDFSNEVISTIKNKE